MTLAADCFRCPGSNCPAFIRETCRRFVDLKEGVGPGTPYADASLVPDESQITLSRPKGWSGYGPCPHKWPLTT